MSDANYLATYESEFERLNDRRIALENQLRALLAERGIHVHSVSSRMKEPASVASKLRRPDKTYSQLWDMTDLVGLRIVTFFEDSIQDVAALIERGFKIDYTHSVNKLQLDQHDRFGYRSLHYVCHDEREAEPLLRFEIQIRTILQHAWAEIEHDLGYKAGELAPTVIRRRFSRVASLLEIADQEFVSIRNDLNDYVRQVSDSSLVPLDLDVVSLSNLVEQPTVRALDHAIGEHLAKPVSSEIFYPAYVIRALEFAGLRDIRSLQRELDRGRRETESLIKPYLQFIKTVLKFDPATMPAVPRGYSLLLFTHWYLLAKEPLDINKIRRIADLYEAIDEPTKGLSSMELATGFLNIVRSH